MEVYLIALLGNYDKLTDQPSDHQTDVRGLKEVTLQISMKSPEEAADDDMADTFLAMGI